MKIHPINRNILIQIEKEEKTSFGLILAEEKHLERAKVLELDSEVTAVKKGDLILFKEFSTDRITLEGKELYFIKDEHVLCTITTTK